MKNLLSFILLTLLLPTTAWSGPALKALTPAIEAAHAEGKRPLVIFDLDDTLFDTRYRIRQILLEFATLNSTAEKYPYAVAPLASLDPREIQFSVPDTLRMLGLNAPELHAELDPFWKSRFFSNDYLKYDHLLPRARALTHSLTALGVRLIYLTGRDRPRMGRGTLDQLAAFALPGGSQGVLFMKPEATIPDREYKASTLNTIAAMGQVIGAFENEPTNANLLQEHFGQAKVYLLETVESGRPIRLDPRVERIRSL